MIALIIILLYIVLRIYIKVLEIKEEQNPKWINYTKDTYKGWYFKWEYSKYYDTYSIKNLRTICECGCGLSNKRRHHNIYYSNGILVCPKCDRSYDYWKKVHDEYFTEEFKECNKEFYEQAPMVCEVFEN